MMLPALINSMNSGPNVKSSLAQIYEASSLKEAPRNASLWSSETEFSGSLDAWFVPKSSWASINEAFSLQRVSLQALPWSTETEFRRSSTGDQLPMIAIPRRRIKWETFADSFDSSYFAAVRSNSSSTSNAEVDEKIELERFKKKFQGDLLVALRRDPPEPGMECEADEVLNAAISHNSPVTFEALTDLFLRSLQMPARAADILTLLSRLHKHVAYPVGAALVLLGLTHTSPAVQESAIRAIETWRHPESAMWLASLQPSAPWLARYRQAVVDELGASA